MTYKKGQEGYIAEGQVVKLKNKISSSVKGVKNKFDKIKLSEKDEKYLNLTGLIENSRILYKTKTVFPFVFFPDELIIDKDKISVITNIFFGSSRIQSVLIRNLSDCYVDTSVFFATLNMTDKYYSDNPLSIKYLKKKDAIKARDIIQGLIICNEKRVDLSEIKASDLLPYLEEIGRATAV